MPGQVQDLNQQTVCNDLRLVCGININSVNNKDHIIKPVNCGKKTNKHDRYQHAREVFSKSVEKPFYQSIHFICLQHTCSYKKKNTIICSQHGDFFSPFSGGGRNSPTTRGYGCF